MIQFFAPLLKYCEPEFVIGEFIRRDSRGDLGLAAVTNWARECDDETTLEFLKLLVMQGVPQAVFPLYLRSRDENPLISRVASLGRRRESTVPGLVSKRLSWIRRLQNGASGF